MNQSTLQTEFPGDNSKFTMGSKKDSVGNMIEFLYFHLLKIKSTETAK